ncbi:magnesium transporter ApaG [alpha proteobacterium AAP81b]|nr:magnesium transporter ApaG [alpha proteobacterium AAP81b]
MVFPYAAITAFGAGSIIVRVAPHYLADQSDPAEPRFVWAYHVRVENHGGEPVQIVARNWVITDGEGRTEQVDGPGVVGQQPVIAPAAAYDYVSGCPLVTPSGTMHGHYAMRTATAAFNATIPLFRLEGPRQ